MKLLRTLSIAGSLLLFGFGCASEQKYNSVSDQFPKISSGQGRMYFYRDSGFIGSGAQDSVSLNDEKVGYVEAGFFFYLDRPAGNYTVTAQGTLIGWKNQLSFALGDGETKYIRLRQKLAAPTPSVVPTLEDKDTALKKLFSCKYNAEGKHKFRGLLQY